MRLRTFILAAWLAAAPATAAPPKLAEAIASRERPVGMVVLDASRKPLEVLGFLGLRRGDTVLDVIAGLGYYTDIMAGAVGPRGRIVALEPPVFLPDEQAAWTALTKRAPNVTLLAAMPDDVVLPPARFDFVLMHLAYHDLYWSSSFYRFPETDPAAFLRKIFAATRPGGIVGVVDHIASPNANIRETVEKLHRIDPAVIKADFARAGFVLEAESDLLRVADDDHSRLPFAPGIRGKTDRVVLRFRKPR